MAPKPMADVFAAARPAAGTRAHWAQRAPTTSAEFAEFSEADDPERQYAFHAMRVAAFLLEQHPALRTELARTKVPLPDPRDADPEDEALARFLRVTLRDAAA